MSLEGKIDVGTVPREEMYTMHKLRVDKILLYLPRSHAML